MAPLPLLKIASILFRTIAKPIASRVKAQAKTNPKFRDGCIAFAQQLHKAEVKLRRWSADEKVGGLVRRLDDERAIETGANFISEGIIFSVAIGVLLWDNVASRAKSTEEKAVLERRLVALEAHITRATVGAIEVKHASADTDGKPKQVGIEPKP